MNEDVVVSVAFRPPAAWLPPLATRPWWPPLLRRKTGSDHDRDSCLLRGPLSMDDLEALLLRRLKED